MHLNLHFHTCQVLKSLFLILITSLKTRLFYLCPEQNNENETALHCAAQYGHSEVVAVLLEELTDPTIRNSKLETPLDLAALYGRLRVVKMIITAHPNLMSCNTRKHTPLHLAARNGHKAVVQVLLEAGMDVSCQVSVLALRAFKGDAAAPSACGNTRGVNAQVPTSAELEGCGFLVDGSGG